MKVCFCEKLSYSKTNFEYVGEYEELMIGFIKPLLLATIGINMLLKSGLLQLPYFNRVHVSNKQIGYSGLALLASSAFSHIIFH